MPVLACKIGHEASLLFIYSIHTPTNNLFYFATFVFFTNLALIYFLEALDLFDAKDRINTANCKLIFVYWAVLGIPTSIHL